MSLRLQWQVDRHCPVSIYLFYFLKSTQLRKCMSFIDWLFRHCTKITLKTKDCNFKEKQCLRGNVSDQLMRMNCRKDKRFSYRKRLAEKHWKIWLFYVKELYIKLTIENIKYILTRIFLCFFKEFFNVDNF